MAQVMGTLVKCSKCGRKILIERLLCGVSHTTQTVVNCWDCLDKEAQNKATELYKLDKK